MSDTPIYDQLVEEQRVERLREARAASPGVIGFGQWENYHAVRLGIQGVEILTTGKLNLPVAEPGATWLRALREGGHTLEETVDKIGELQYLLRHLVASADLPQRCDRAKVNSLLVELYLGHWDMHSVHWADTEEHMLVA